MTRSICMATLVLSCCAILPGRAAPPVVEPATGAEKEYTRGTQALDQQRWQDAVTIFDHLGASKGAKADAAIYWKAYALNKLGRFNLVSATCTQLQATYANSTWNKDCAALTLSADGASGNLSARSRDREELSSTSDADLKVLALNSLLRREPAQVLPLVRNILAGGGPPELQSRVLSMLAQSSSPDAQALLREVAMGKFAPGEQRQAIQMMGLFQGKRGNDTLAEIYRTTSEVGIKRAVVSAFYLSGDAQRMVDLARNEKSLELKHSIVAQLALMHDKAATDYMLELLK